jgi:hypothetical protein
MKELVVVFHRLFSLRCTENVTTAGKPVAFMTSSAIAASPYQSIVSAMRKSAPSSTAHLTCQG